MLGGACSAVHTDVDQARSCKQLQVARNGALADGKLTGDFLRRRLALYQAVDNSAAGRVCQRCDDVVEVWGLKMVKDRLMIF